MPTNIHLLSIYAKPLPLHHLSYQLFGAAIEYIDL